MKKRIALNFISIVLCLSLLITMTYAWWLSGAHSNRVIIITANIASKIEISEGIDFNHDGFLDLTNGAPTFGPVIDKDSGNTGGEAPKISITMKDIAPTKVFTWKAKVTNQGDADGYVVARLNDNLITDENYLKFLSIKLQDRPNEKSYFVDALKTRGEMENQKHILFGGKTEDIVLNDVGKNVKEYIFQIELEDFDTLKALGKIEGTKEEMLAYQALQGKPAPGGTKETPSYEYLFVLDIALQSEKPGTNTAGL